VAVLGLLPLGGGHMKGMIGTASALLLLAASLDVPAHPGGLDKHGCHNNRSTGEYHCHRGSAAPASRSDLQRSPTRTDAAPARAAGGELSDGAEAGEAGAAAVRRGEPGYGPDVDRDNDGIGCEPYRGR